MQESPVREVQSVGHTEVSNCLNSEVRSVGATQVSRRKKCRTMVVSKSVVFPGDYGLGE
jgi:hypothetical protein